MKENLADKLTNAGQSLQEYLKIRLKLMKLDVLEKMTKISVFIISTVGFTILGILFFVFVSAAFVVWYGNRTDNYLTGLFIVIGLIVLAALCLYLFRKTILSSFLIRNFSTILFEEENEEENMKS